MEANYQHKISEDYDYNFQTLKKKKTTTQKPTVHEFLALTHFYESYGEARQALGAEGLEENTLKKNHGTIIITIMIGTKFSSVLVGTMLGLYICNF